MRNIQLAESTFTHLPRSNILDNTGANVQVVALKHKSAKLISAEAFEVFCRVYIRNDAGVVHIENHHRRRVSE